MTAAERKAVMKELAQAIKDNGLDDKLKVVCHRETVCALASEGIEDNFTIKCEANFPPDKKEAVDAFTEAAKKITEGKTGIVIKANVVLGPGSKYDPIKNVKPIKGGDPVTLNHVEGEVWLIDFWATWCPPC